MVDAGTILQGIGPYGLAGVLMLGGMKWLREKLEKSEATANQRAAEMQARCDSDRKELSAKVDKLEDRIADIYDSTVTKSVAAINDNAQWLKRFIEAVDRKNDAA